MYIFELILIRLFAYFEKNKYVSWKIKNDRFFYIGKKNLISSKSTSKSLILMKLEIEIGYAYREDINV